MKAQRKEPFDAVQWKGDNLDEIKEFSSNWYYIVEDNEIYFIDENEDSVLNIPLNCWIVSLEGIKRVLSNKDFFKKFILVGSTPE